MSSLRSTLRLLIVTCVLLAGGLSLTPSGSAPANAPTAAIQHVRLRKLHLARPDLILYPISYEWVC